MINKAIEHITKQAMELGDELSILLEEHFTEICTNTRVATKLLNEQKTIKEINQILWKEAQKRKKGNGACIRDAEIYELSEKYFEITEEDKQQRKPLGGKTIDISGLL